MYKMWSKLSLNWSIKIKNLPDFNFASPLCLCFQHSGCFLMFTSLSVSPILTLLPLWCTLDLLQCATEPEIWAGQVVSECAGAAKKLLSVLRASTRSYKSQFRWFLLNVFRLVASECKTDLIVSHTVKDEFTMHIFMHIDKMTSPLLVPFLTCSA